MSNYTFLNATGGTQTAASSTISGVEYPIIKISDPVSVVGAFTQSGTQITSVSGTVVVESVVGTYAENAQFTTGSKGLFPLGIRNDTLASITAVDNAFTPFTVGPVGEMVVANAPITKWIFGTASVLGPAQPVQPIITAQGTSIFTYITGVQVTNPSSASVMVALQSGATTLGYVMAEANTTIPVYYSNGLKTLTNGAFSASIIGGAVASVYLSAQGFISKT